MHTALRRIHTSVIKRLLDKSQGFGFFQVVRLLELYFHKRAPGSRLRDAVSHNLRFTSSLSLSFPASEIERLYAQDALGDPIDADDAGELERVSITPTFLGLLGASGTLPAQYTEKLSEREQYSRDYAARAFIEIFSNRAIALFYQAWKKYRLPLQYELDRKQRFMPMMLALSGLRLDSEKQIAKSGSHLYDEMLANYSAALRQRPMSASYMQQVLADFFKTQIRIEQFIGHWYRVPNSERTSLSGMNAVLGSTALCGSRVWQRNLRVRLWIGPLARAEYEQFLPDGAAQGALVQLLMLMTGDMLEYEIRPILHRTDVSGISLGVAGGQARLGWDAFMCTRPAPVDRLDASYTLQAAH